MKNNQTRREFLKRTSRDILGIGMASAPFIGVPSVSGAEDKVKVAVVRNERAISDRNVCDKKQAALMIEQALFTITGTKNVKKAWTSLGVTKDDIVAIKVNCNSWTFLLYTHPELVYALCDSLHSVINPNNIIIYERSTSELTQCGYRANKTASGIRCFGNNEGGGFHEQEGLTRIITDTCTKIINFPSLKCVDGEFAGSLFLKNHIGSLPTSNMSRCHGYADYCNRVCTRPSIKNKTILAICDGLRGTYRRGRPWYYKGIIMSRDQVAAECAALNIINEKRKAKGIKELAIPSYVKKADKLYSLGTCDPSKITVEKSQI